MAPIRRTWKKNIPFLLQREQLGFPCRNRIESSLVRDNNITYSEICCIRSKGPVYCVQDRIFTDNYRTVLSTTFGNKEKAPLPLFKLKNAPDGEWHESIQIIDHLFLSPFSYASFDAKNDSSYKSTLLLLTDDNLLCKLDPITGATLNVLFFGPKKEDVWFNLICDVDDDKYAIVTTDLNPSPASFRRFAIFGLFPFHFVAMFDLMKDVFGKHCSDAFIKKGVLCVLTGNNPVMKFYSLEDIMSSSNKTCSCDIGQACSRHGPVGTIPSGIQPNIILTTENMPPILFKLKTSDVCDFGGYPYHIAYKNFGGTIMIKRLCSNEAIYLPNVEGSDENKDNCEFMDDLSNRVLVTRRSAVEVYDLNAEHEKLHRKVIDMESMKNFKLPFDYHAQELESSQTYRPRRESALQVRVRGQTYVYATSEFPEAHVLAVLYRDTKQKTLNSSAVGVYDSRDGALVKKIALSFAIDEFIDYKFQYYSDYFVISGSTATVPKEYFLRMYRIVRRAEVVPDIIMCHSSEAILHE